MYRSVQFVRLVQSVQRFQFSCFVHAFILYAQPVTDQLNRKKCNWLRRTLRRNEDIIATQAPQWT